MPSVLRPSVLIADDEPAIADTLALILQKHGFAATKVYNGEEAIQIASGSTPDTFITDIIMDGTNGIEAALCVRELCPRCRIILISGNRASAGLLEDARAKGLQFELLAKPFQPAELLALLQSPPQA